MDYVKSHSSFPWPAGDRIGPGLCRLYYFTAFIIAGLSLDMAVAEGIAGFRGFVVAFALFPLTHIIVPWYALPAYGSWTLIIVCYGGVMAGALVIAVGMSIKDKGLRCKSGLVVSSPDDELHRTSGEVC